MSDVLMSKVLGVYEILNSYIEIHNDVFKSSLRRVVPIPGVFESINYDKHQSRLLELAGDLASLISGVEGDDGFAVALREYSLAWSETISTLSDLCGRLHRKSQGGQYSYSWRQYQKDLADYHSCQQRYLALAPRLNQYLR